MSRRASSVALLAATSVLGSALACTPLEECSGAKCDDGLGGEPSSSGGAKAPSGGKQDNLGGVPETATGGASAGGKPSTSGGEGPGGQGGEPGAGGSESVAKPELSVEGPERVRIRTGGSVEMAVQVERKGSYEGLVSLSFVDLPSGFVGGSETLPGTETSTALTLLAAGNAETGGPFPIRIRASSLDGEVQAETTLQLTVAGALGTIDPTFGDEGLLLLEAQTAIGLQIDSEGRPYLAANVDDGTNQHGLVARATPDGDWEEAPDFDPPGEGKLGEQLNAFSMNSGGLWLGVRGYDIEGVPTDGVLRLGFEGEKIAEFGTDSFLPGYVAKLAARPSGGVYTSLSNGSFQALLASGAPDPDFVADPYTRAPFLPSNAVDSEDRLWLSNIFGENMRLLRFLKDGTPDIDFGDNGSAVVATDPSHPQWVSTFVRDDGSFVGSYDNGKVLALTPSGEIDTDFGTDGVLSTSLWDNVQVVPVEGGFVCVSSDAGYPWMQLRDPKGGLVSAFGNSGFADYAGQLTDWGLTEGSTKFDFSVEDPRWGRLIVAGSGPEGVFLFALWL